MFRVIVKNKFGCGFFVEIGLIFVVDLLGKRDGFYGVCKVNIVCL